MPYWPVSGRWDQALRVGHEIVTTVELWQNGVRQTMADGSTSLRVDDGTITITESSKVRRTLSCTIANPELLPAVPTDLLSPPAAYLKVFLGFRYTQGDTEMVPCGVFRVSSAGQSSWLAGIQLAADDSSKVLADDRFATWATPAGNTVVSEIARMARDSIPGLTVIDLTGSKALTSVASFDKERWDAMTSLAGGISAEIFFDQIGRLIIRPVPQVAASSTSVWTVDAGNSSAVMTDVATSMSVDKVYNAVIATSSAQGVVASGAAYQQSGPFAWPGWRRRRFYSSPVMTTAEQCESAAKAILARSLAFSRQISPQAVPNPALDVGDIITVTLPADATGRVVSEKRVVSRITLPLGFGPMSLETRVGVDAAVTADVGSLS